ncbi:MAG: hypothetical protein LBN93_06785 [Candidatus Symbiothrix sp.]|nr:hypothetical protein [Candidatus Symbiothrix sp.]
MKKVSLFFTALCLWLSFGISNMSAQAPNGTYVPCNEVARSLYYSKMVFSGSKVKMYMGIQGMALPVAYEYTYKLSGNALTVIATEGGQTGSVDFTYDKGKDQILLSTGSPGYEAVWGREGKSDCTFLSIPQEDCVPKSAAAGSKYTLRWKSVECAIKYKVLWFFYGYDGLQKDKGTDLTDKLEWTRILPDERGTMKMKIYSVDAYKESKESLDITIEVMKGEGKGKLIFLTHGLEDSRTCFEKTVKLLNNYNNYFDLGYITMRVNGNISAISSDMSCINYTDVINEMTEKGINVLIRTEFSSGNLSFNNQLVELKKMVEFYKGHNADVVFIGHSMGGLASINYGIDYAGTYTAKKVIIITVDTPYHPNNYAKIVWGGKDEKPEMFSFISQVASEQIRGEAHRDLGGFGNALSDLQNKWNNYKGTAELYAISVSMYKKDANSSDIGDGVVDIPSQRGEKDKKGEWYWNNVSRESTIYGTSQSKYGVPLEGLSEKSNPYHHTRTPALSEVISQIGDIIEE